MDIQCVTTFPSCKSIDNLLDEIDSNEAKQNESKQNNDTERVHWDTNKSISEDTKHIYDLQRRPSTFLCVKHNKLETMDQYLQIHHQLLKEQRNKMHPYAYKILKFWFPNTFHDCMDLWFGKDEETDAVIIKNYKHLLESDGKYDNWCFSSPLECLALVILYDQFPRNIYRNDIKMYSFDTKCKHLLTNALWQGYHLQLLPIHAVSFCLVLTHAESPLLQELCMKVWGEVRLSINDENELVLFDDIFQKHFDVIEQFGHFPHRNQIFGRNDTESETEFLRRKSFRFDLPLKPDRGNNNSNNAFQFVESNAQNNEA